jgi:2-amino-4-hydroxy-6-hydroxymethyldihydropteridine diphosphokinase
MVRVYVGLGANLGDRGEAMLQALQAMAVLPHTQLVAVSSLYSSAPVDASGPDYLNAVAALETTQAPEAFLQALQALELAAGRERPYRNAPRTLDLDIVLWGAQQLATPVLTVPHPRMYERAFVLKPLAELDAALVSAAQLAAVAGQRIAVAQDAHWADAACPRA